MLAGMISAQGASAVDNRDQCSPPHCDRPLSSKAIYWPADEEDVIYALNAKDTARALGLQKGAAKVRVRSREH
jgi:hypothetical protein